MRKRRPRKAMMLRLALKILDGTRGLSYSYATARIEPAHKIVEHVAGPIIRRRAQDGGLLAAKCNLGADGGSKAPSSGTHVY